MELSCTFHKRIQKRRLDIKNIRGNFEAEDVRMAYDRNRKCGIKDTLRKLDLWQYLKLKKDHIVEARKCKTADFREQMFIHSDENLFTGQQLKMKLKGVESS